jgi:hypothetical protein
MCHDFTPSSDRNTVHKAAILFLHLTGPAENPLA